MSAIQSGSNWWIDSVTRFSGGNIGRAFRSGAMNQTAAPAVSWADSDDSDSLSSAISDTEEEGEMGPSHAGAESDASPMDLIAEEIDSNSTDTGVSEEIIAATAMHIGVIEAAMRKHQATRVVKFDDDEAHSGDDQPSDDSFKASMLIALLQNPGAALCANGPGPDRLRILSLLAN